MHLRICSPTTVVPRSQFVLSKASARVAEHGGSGIGQSFLTSKRKGKARDCTSCPAHVPCVSHAVTFPAAALLGQAQHLLLTAVMWSADTTARGPLHQDLIAMTLVMRSRLDEAKRQAL